MLGPFRSAPFRLSLALMATLAAFFGCSASQPKKTGARQAPTRATPATSPSTAKSEIRSAPTPPAEATGARATVNYPSTPPAALMPIMLGIDVLAAENFAPIAGKRIGLLTHPAGINREGVSTVEILHKAPNVKLVALFGPEHGIYGDHPASANIGDVIDKRTGLPAYSLHGDNRKPTKAQLKNLDALVIDLQDIGVRSYTFNVVMRYAIDSCFTHGVEVVVLDRPNPLGGLKVDGPILDREWFSGVGAYQIPYVHGLTIGELARMAVNTPGALEVSEEVRVRGKLTVIPMRGWRRSMRWPETGLTFAPTSPLIQDFAACVGYAMTGLGCEIGGFSHGLGKLYPFRGISYAGKKPDVVQQELQALKLPGLAFRLVSVPDRKKQPTVGVYVEVTDWDDWRPTELSFHMMRLACKWSGSNPFAAANAADARRFNIHTGSTTWWNALKREGARVDVEAFLQDWRQRNQTYREATRPYWLYL